MAGEHKGILDKMKIWKNSSNKFKDQLDITIYKMSTNAGVKRQVTLYYYISADGSRKSIMLPWIHLSRFVYFGKAILKEVKTVTCSNIN
jgi:hypothetical protein